MVELTWIHYAIICPVVFFAGFVDAIAGGGGLISLPVYLFTGLPVQAAVCTNKLSATLGTVSATYKYWRQGFINWKRALPSLVFALLGSFIGAQLLLYISDAFFNYLMLVVLPLSGFYVLKSSKKPIEREPFSSKTTLILSIFIAFFIGIYDGFYGPGTGTFLLLLLTGLARVPMEQAAGTAKLINLTTNITALTVFLIEGTALLPLGITAGLFSIAGNYLGSRSFVKSGAKFVYPVILFVLIVFFIKICFEIF